MSAELLCYPARTYQDKFARLAGRLKDPEWRRYARLLLLGKFLGLTVLIGMVFAVPMLMQMLSGSPAMAQQAAAMPATGPSMLTSVVQATDPYVNPINTTWTLLGAFLVFGMQAGFTMLEAGFCRSRETVNVLVECVFDTCLCGILYYAWGYAFMFGAGNGLIGWHDPANADQSWFFLKNVTAFTLYGATGVPVLAHFVFQFAFADCASTICSGTMIGRTSFWGDILYSVCVSGFIYPILGHWCWGPDGFLATMGAAKTVPFTGFLESMGMGFHDFAGSTVVHSIGGWIALAGGICLGPRLGRKFKRDGGGPMLPHDLTIAVVGGLILWFGWYGFNPGSTLSAMDIGGIGRVACNTTLAACAAGLVAVFIGYAMMGTWDASFITNGFLAGLVAITASCYYVSPTGAILLGGIAGGVVILGVELLEFLRIDDPIGAWPVHGLCGIWGTLSIGFFATGEFAGGSSPTGTPVVTDAAPGLAGLFYGGGATVLKAQLIGSAVICVSTFVLAMAVFGALKAVKLLRVSEKGELEGLDIHEHGISAYPEYVISAIHAPQGMPSHAVNAGGKSTSMSSATGV
ncbi:MAG: ammonium transporter [Phycisphaerales bacterium]|nr:ammonium transporter [Phycisphaerales bacterium]